VQNRQAFDNFQKSFLQFLPFISQTTTQKGTRIDVTIYNIATKRRKNRIGINLQISAKVSANSFFFFFFWT